MALSGTEQLFVTGILPNGQLAATTQPTTTGAIAALSTGSSTYPINNNLTTAGNGTLLAAALDQRLITRSGPTSAFTDTTDTAANIIAAMPAGAAVGTVFTFKYINTTIYPATIAAGTGVTLSGIGSIVPANSTSEFIVTYTGAGAVSFQMVISVYDNGAGYDPSTVATQFGSGTATFLEEGNVYKNVATASINPGSTGNDNVLAVFSIPANSFDGISNRGICITAQGSVANNTNSKRMKIIYNPSAAVVGSAVTGGTTIADTGAYTTTGAAGWQMSAQVFKYGAAGSNTQLALHESSQVGNTVSALVVPQYVTATESGAILVAVTGNAATTATDIALNFAQINAMN